MSTSRAPTPPPGLHGVGGSLESKIRRPLEDVAVVPVAKPVQTKHETLTDLQRLALKPQLDTALHILEERRHGLLKELPGCLR